MLSTGGEIYVVKSGDTLTQIAKRHGTTVKAIEAENNLTTTKIKVGQKLKIPAKAEAAAPVRRRADAGSRAPAPVTDAEHNVQRNKRGREFAVGICFETLK